MPQNKKIPLRMCLACRQMLPKTDMLRVVKLPNEQFVLDETGKANGRGAYICRKTECVQKCDKSKLLHKNFKGNVSSDVYAQLKEHNE